MLKLVNLRAVILNLFQDNATPWVVILKQVQDHVGSADTAQTGLTFRRYVAIMFR